MKWLKGAETLQRRLFWIVRSEYECTGSSCCLQTSKHTLKPFDATTLLASGPRQNNSLKIFCSLAACLSDGPQINMEPHLDQDLPTLAHAGHQGYAEVQSGLHLNSHHALLPWKCRQMQAAAQEVGYQKASADAPHAVLLLLLLLLPPVHTGAKVVLLTLLPPLQCLAMKKLQPAALLHVLSPCQEHPAGHLDRANLA